MTAGTELWEAHECNKPGHLRKDCSVHKERIAEERNKPKGERERERVETTAVVQAEMVERWEHADRDCVFACGHEVSANVQKRERHSCKDGGASRSACHSGRITVLTAKGTAPTNFE